MCKSNIDNEEIEDVLNGFGIGAIIAGAASGALAASGAGVARLIAGNALISMAENAADQVIANRGFKNFDAVDMMLDGAISAISASSSTANTSAKHLMNLGKQSVTRPMKEIKQNGVKAGIREAKKAASYYVKNTKELYKRQIIELKKSEFWEGEIAFSIASLDFMKNQYRQIPRYIVMLSE